MVGKVGGVGKKMDSLIDRLVLWYHVKIINKIKRGEKKKKKNGIQMTIRVGILALANASDTMKKFINVRKIKGNNK
jgi:hypothetical protein